MFQLVLVLMAAPNPVDDGRINDPGVVMAEDTPTVAAQCSATVARHVGAGMIVEPDAASRNEADLLSTPNPVDDGRINDPGIMIQEKHVALANDGMLLEPDAAKRADEDPMIIEAYDLEEGPVFIGAMAAAQKVAHSRVDDGRVIESDFASQRHEGDDPIIIDQSTVLEVPSIIG